MTILIGKTARSSQFKSEKIFEPGTIGVELIFRRAFRPKTWTMIKQIAPTEGAGSAVIQLPIPHVRQTKSWNCGIACINMVCLKSEGKCVCVLRRVPHFSRRQPKKCTFYIPSCLYPSIAVPLKIGRKREDPTKKERGEST